MEAARASARFTGVPAGAGENVGWQEYGDIPARPSFALPRLQRLLYRPSSGQMGQIGKVPGYGI